MHRAGGPAPLGEALQQHPQLVDAAAVVLVAVGAQAACGGGRADADVRQQHRQQDQVGQDQHRHADAGGQRQVLDHRDVDHHQHRETHRVGQQRRHPGQEQAAEGVARGHQLVRALADVLHDAVHLLRAVRHADGEDQEGHQDRIGVDLEAEGRHQAQLPQHRHQRAGQDQRGAAHAARVVVDDGRGDDRGEAEIQRHAEQAFDQVADQLGEADDVHAHRRRLAVAGDLVLVADRFDALRQRAVVDALAALRVLVEQRHDDHARLVVVADQAADQPRARDVAAQLFGHCGRAVVVVGHHRAAAETLFGDLGPAHRRRPQRLDPGPVDARRQHQFVVDLAQRLEVLRVVDVAVRVLDHDAQRVAQAAQFVAILQVVLDVRVADRQHALEAGVQRQPGGGEEAEQHGDHRAEHDDGAPVVEHQPLEARAAVRVEGVQSARQGQVVGGGGGMHGVSL